MIDSSTNPTHHTIHPRTIQMDCRSRFDKQESKPMLDVRSCTGVSYDTFVGRCQCAALDARYVGVRPVFMDGSA